MTRADHPTGTDRVAEVAARLAEPGSSSTSRATSPRSPARRSTSSSPLLEDDPEAPMATLATPIRDEAVYRDPSCVKVVCSPRGRALYFSRSPIPCHRDGLPDPATAAPPVAHLHLGLYAYRRDFLLDARHAAPLPARSRREARAAPRARGRLPDRRRHRRRAEHRHRHARGLPPVRRALEQASRTARGVTL